MSHRALSSGGQFPRRLTRLARTRYGHAKAPFPRPREDTNETLWPDFLVAAATAVLTNAGPAGAETKLKMLYTAVTGFSSSYLAQEAGFFKKRGIDMEFVLTASSGNNPPALVSGSVQVAGPTMPTLLQADDAGLDIVVIAGGAVYPLTGDILVARQGSGIEKPTDLKGKTVGVPGLGALLHFMLRRSLKANGVDPNSVQYVEIGFPQAADALRSGQIDAYPAQAPFTARILQSGAGYEVANWLKDTPDGTLDRRLCDAAQMGRREQGHGHRAARGDAGSQRLRQDACG